MKNKFPVNSQELMFLAGVAMMFYTIFKESGIDIWISVLRGLSIFVSTTILWGMTKFWQASENRFRIITNLNGANSYNDIIKAKKSILVTHFSTDVPTDEYISLMLGKLQQGVVITRVIPELVDKSKEKFSWLKQVY